MKRKYLNYIGYAVMVVCFLFLGRAIYKLHPDFAKITNPVACAALSLALSVCSAGVVYFSAAAWKGILQFIHGKKLPYREIAAVYVKSNIAKYLPGNVMHFAGRNLLAGRLGFSQVDIAFATLTEVLVLVVTACLWWAALAFGPFVTFLHGTAGLLQAHFGYAVLIVAAVLAAAAGVFLFLYKKGYFAKYRRFFTRGFIKLLGKLFVMYSLTLLLPGVFMLLLFVLPFGCPFTLHNALLTIAAYAASWVAGYIVIGVPGGIGVRESVLLLILAPLYPKDIVLIVAILSRIVSIIGDAAAFGAAPLFLRGQPALPGQTKQENGRPH